MGVDGLDHVQVAAPPGCEREARRFYGELLGLRELAKPDALQRGGGVWFAAGGQELHVGVTDDFAPARKAHPGLRVGSDAALDELAGAASILVIEDLHWADDATLDLVAVSYTHLTLPTTPYV